MVSGLTDFFINVLVPRGVAVGEGQVVPPPGAAEFKERQNEFFNSTNVQLLTQIKGNLTIEFGFFISVRGGHFLLLAPGAEKPSYATGCTHFQRSAS